MKKPLPRKSGEVIKKLYAARDELRQLFPGFSFPLDGKLVGDIGEVIAIDDFDLEKLPEGTKHHDFTKNGCKIQVKATQKIQSGSVGLGRDKHPFEHLIVFQIFEDGTYSVLYNGPGSYVEQARKHKDSPSLSVSQLRSLDEKVKPQERIKPR